MRQTFLYILYAMAVMTCITACEKADLNDSQQGNVTLLFYPDQQDGTRAVGIGEYFTKLNVQIFDVNGNKVFDKVKTQTIEEEGFGQLNLTLAEGSYSVVAVGHSSKVSATIKSTQMVQFTARDGEKLTDTFCYCGRISVGEEHEQHELTMERVTAMFRVVLTDEQMSTAVAKMKFDYTGGSANFNPTTFEGTTKSTQSELRTAGGSVYCCYTFPYLSDSGSLKITLSALTEDGTVIRKMEFTDVPITRNRITTYTGQFFTGDEGNITQSGLGFTINSDWAGEDHFTF